MIPNIMIPKSICSLMQVHVEREAPLEACGILGGRDRKACHIIQVENIEKSQTRYRMDPQAQIDTFIQLEKKNLDLIAIYHSHPRGTSYPSQIDIDQAFYPDSVQLIWSSSSNSWRCRAYLIKRRVIEEIEILILDDE